MRQSWILAMTGLACLGLGSCATAPADTGPKGEPTLAWIQTNVFDTSCAASGCHAGAKGAGGLDLSAGKAYAQLIQVAGAEKDKDGVPLPRVAPGNADRSLLSLVLAGPYGANQGMPSGLKLEQYKIDAINAWIQAGAPEK